MATVAKNRTYGKIARLGNNSKTFVGGMGRNEETL
jgi:hypothetical protein